MLITCSVGGVACGVAHQTYIHPQFEQYDKQKTVHVAMYVLQEQATQQAKQATQQAKNTNNQKTVTQDTTELKIANMWGVMAQKYLNDKRDYFVSTRKVIHTVQNIPCQAPLQ